jgi:conserved oligomeric Golgi complex subunit 1
MDSFLGKYRSSLKRQLEGRTPALHDVLSVLEECANSLKSDISEALVGSDDTR